MIFKVGDRVKLEGVIIDNPNNLAYPFLVKANGANFSITKDGRVNSNKDICIELVERPKVKKYKVLYSDKLGYKVSITYYIDENDFNTSLKRYGFIFMQLLESTEKEFEE